MNYRLNDDPVTYLLNTEANRSQQLYNLLPTPAPPGGHMFTPEQMMTSPTRSPLNTEANRSRQLYDQQLAPAPPGGHMFTAEGRHLQLMTSPTIIQRDLCGGIIQVGQIGPPFG